MLTAEECRQLSYKAESTVKRENDELQERQWRDWFPEVERILGVINYEVEEEIKFNCTVGRYSAIIHILDDITFYIGNSYVSSFLRRKTFTYIINAVYDRYVSNGFKVEISDDVRDIRISWG